jgi:hypothetical protein
MVLELTEISHMLDPYENILIGNFLFSLGLVIGSRSTKPIPAAVNLLQQTPLDGPLGDVIIECPGLVRLIEFKRKSNKSPKEPAKRALLEAALQVTPRLFGVSRKIHWYIESSEAPLTWKTEIFPYIDFDKPRKHQTSFIAFVEDLAMAAIDVVEDEFPPEDIALYLRTVSMSSKKSGTSSALLVFISREGLLNHIVLEDLRDISTALKTLKQQAEERREEMSLEREQVQTYDRGRSYD